MRKMRIEKLIQIVKQRGIEFSVKDGELYIHGASHLSQYDPLIRLMSLHYPELCTHFGVKS